MDLGETLGRLGAISLAAKDYEAAQGDFQKAVMDFDLAGADAKTAKKQVQILWSRARQEGTKKLIQ